MTIEGQLAVALSLKISFFLACLQTFYETLEFSSSNVQHGKGKILIPSSLWHIAKSK